MDPQKSAASRVRHILNAMERSIDAARSRRVGYPLPAGDSSSTERLTNPAQAIRPAPTPTSPVVSQAPHTPTARPPFPSQERSAGQLMIGAPPASGPTPAPVTRAPATPQIGEGQPPRLKAKPKRFEGNMNSAFAPPPAYRSQAG